jgi:hypothetical protein
MQYKVNELLHNLDLQYVMVKSAPQACNAVRDR